MTTSIIDSDTYIDSFHKHADIPFINYDYNNNYETTIVEEKYNLFNISMLEYSFCKSNNDSDWSIVKITTNESHYIYTHILNNMINQLNFRKEWIEQRIQMPNVSCKNMVLNICIVLFKRYHIIPQRVSASIEGGIFIQYLNSNNHRTLSIEVYNDLDIASMVNDVKQRTIISSENINQMSFDSIMRYFNE